MKNTSHAALYCLALLAAAPLAAQPLFEEATADIGHQLFVAGGIALQDYDNDGWPDLFMASEANDGANPVALLRNNADGSFADRAAQIAAVEQLKWKGEGNAWADYDNDGDLDLFIPRGQVRNYEPDLLLRNDQGTFTDVSEAGGFVDVLPSNIAVWLDYDRDGHIDLYVGHFIVDFENPGIFAKNPDLANSLYRNQGDGTFVDVTQSAGLAVPLHPDGLPFAGGSPLGMAAADFDDDGWPDLYITALFAPNRLFINQRDGTFAEAPAGDLNDPGEAFGMAIGDIDNDGDLDIFQPSGVGEQRFRSPLLLNRGNGVFLDITESAGLESLTDQNTRGGVFFEADNDGDLDLLIPFPLSFFLNNGDGTFTEATATSGLALIGGQTSIADYDNDGFLDFATGGNSPNEIPTKLHRNTGGGNHFLRVELVGVESNRSAIGARLRATAGDRVQTRQLLGSLGTSQYELSAHFGLGSANAVDQLEIRWPNGLVETFADIPADREIRIIEGRGQWHPVARSVWSETPPEQLTFGREVTVSGTVRPALFEPTATITTVTADLGSLGGPQVPLIPLGDGTYRFEQTFAVGGDHPQRAVEVLVLQQTSLGEHWLRLTHSLEVSGDPNTAILEHFTEGTPDAFALDQNFPNPFNSGTVIRFTLPQNQDIELSVYNLAGQKVATLVQGQRAAGSYAIHWDGRDDQERALASGLYLYRLRAGEQTSTRKLLLLQ